MSTRQKKSKAKRRQPTMRDLRVLREITEFDPNGIEVTHHRTVDTLGMMLESCYHIRHGYRGTRFPGGFHDRLLRLHAKCELDLDRTSPSRRHDVRDLTDNQVAARERVARALNALGGHGSPAGSCVWHVIGMQTSIREWALRQGWGGRPVRQESAQGIWLRRSGCSRSTTASAISESGNEHKQNCHWGTISASP